MCSETPSRSAAGAGVPRAGGFALLIMLLLLALIASVLVALTTLVGRETSLQNKQMAYRQAQLNAQFALLEALGSLQQHAGKDAAITARAQMLGEDAETGEARAEPHAVAWTGVWQADASGAGSAAPHWLVSGAGSPTVRLDASRSALLVAERGTGGGDAPAVWEAVRVPLVTLEGGAYGWWIGDEGVKVNIGAPNSGRGSAQAWLSAHFPASQLERLATLLPGPSVNSVLPQAAPPVAARMAAALREPDEQADAAQRAQILEIASLGQLAEGRPDAAFGYSSDLFHEVTFGSHGVLADPLRGLRADYSQSPQHFPLGGQFALYADYASVMEVPIAKQNERNKFIPTQDDLRRRYKMRVTDPVSAGEVSAAIGPVLTDCYMVFNVHRVHANDMTKIVEDDPNRPREAQRNRVMIHAGLVVELWNPYTSALVPQDLLLEVEGLPRRVWMHPVGSAAGRSEVSIAANLRNGPTGSQSWWVELPFTDKEQKGKTPTWFPGRVYNWTGPNNYAGGSAIRGLGARVGNFFHRDLNLSIWAQMTNVAFPLSVEEFSLEVPDETVLTIRLRIKPQRMADWGSAPVLAEMRNVRFERVGRTDPLNAETLVYQFGYRVSLEDPGLLSGGSAAAWNKSAWLRRNDPRGATHNGKEFGVGAPADKQSYYVPSSQPADYVKSGSKGFFGVSDHTELWSRPMGDSGLIQAEDAPLFELPRHDLLRVADLRHMHIAGLRPHALGNRWSTINGLDVNRVFDLGFFSGVRAGGAAPLLYGSDALPNERLISAVEYPALQQAGADAANWLLLHGAFNINTTSAVAWRAVLAGALYGDFDYIYSDPRNGEFTLSRPTRSARLGRAVARYGQSAAETFDVGDYRSSGDFTPGGLHDPSVAPPTQYFRRGLVELSAEQLDLLAANVSARIRMRARAGLPPFASFAEFLGSQRLAAFRHPQESGVYMSVLEAAIYDTMVDTSLPLRQRLNRDADGQIIWWDTPSFVTAGDLWAQFAHYAAVRSDTFRVRAYGRTTGAAGVTTAEAWCEALVQRLPQLHDSHTGANTDTALAGAGNNGFGRQFRIVSLRWLSRDEL